MQRAHLWLPSPLGVIGFLLHAAPPPPIREDLLDLAIFGNSPELLLFLKGLKKLINLVLAPSQKVDVLFLRLCARERS